MVSLTSSRSIQPSSPRVVSDYEVVGLIRRRAVDRHRATTQDRLSDRRERPKPNGAPNRVGALPGQARPLGLGSPGAQTGSIPASDGVSSSAREKYIPIRIACLFATATIPFDNTPRGERGVRPVRHRGATTGRAPQTECAPRSCRTSSLSDGG